MAVAKNSIRRTRSSALVKSRRRARADGAKTTGAPGQHRIPDSFYFDEVRGKILDDVSVTTSSDGNLITLAFRDKTEMTLEIAPGISVLGMLESWKTGNSRVLKRWPKIRSVGL
jgi:hypothetical protein